MLTRPLIVKQLCHQYPCGPDRVTAMSLVQVPADPLPHILHTIAVPYNCHLQGKNYNNPMCSTIILNP